MVNDKMVNCFMEKKLYNSPLIEVAEVTVKGVLLASPDDTPTPPIDPGMSPIPSRENF